MLASLMSARAASSGERGTAVPWIDTKVSQFDFCHEITLEDTKDVGIMLSHGHLLEVGQTQKCRKSEDQLELERRSQSKIRDRYATPRERPRGAAVFDFRFRSSFEP